MAASQAQAPAWALAQVKAPAGLAQVQVLAGLAQVQVPAGPAQATADQEQLVAGYECCWLGARCG
jgi:hypothetical protein